MNSKRNLLTVSLTITSLLAALAGCAGSRSTAPPPQKREASPAVISGTVVETMNSGGYTYVALESEGKLVWAALPVTRLGVGQNIRIYGGAVMQQFSSKALNRTFDTIVFSGGMAPETGEVAKQDGPGRTAANNEAGKPVMAGKVVETINVGTYTYVLLEKDGRSAWSAIPRAELTVGESIEVLPGIDMVDFRSAKLNRSFPYIHFSGGIKGGAGNPQPKSGKAEETSPPLPGTQHVTEKEKAQ